MPTPSSYLGGGGGVECDPMVLTQAWNDQIQTDKAKSRADLAHQIGVSKAHVIQILRLLRMAPSVQEAVLALGDLIEGRIVGAHTLRSLAKFPVEEQQRRVASLIGGN